MKIKNEAGEEVEVFTQDEADALAKTKADEAADAARQEALVEKEELEKQLKGFQDKEFNFNQLRNKKNKDDEAAQSEAKKLADQLAEVNARLGKVELQPFEKAKVDFMAANNIAGDKEVKDKFDFFFTPLSATAKSEADFHAALVGAYAAATGGSKQPNLGGTMVSTRVTPPSGNTGVVTEAAKEIGSAMGISEDDRKKYGKKK